MFPEAVEPAMPLAEAAVGILRSWVVVNLLLSFVISTLQAVNLLSYTHQMSVHRKQGDPWFLVHAAFPNMSAQCTF